MDIEDLTLREIRELSAAASALGLAAPSSVKPHPMTGRRCVVRTHGAGVHIGTVHAVDGMEVHLKPDALRLWKWEGGGLSLSAVAAHGIKGGRVDKTGEVYLTNAVELIPVGEGAWGTYANYIEK
jgi:hypothetical protein